ncbi:hypothetical protein B9479_001118 [Cryptococcus floricola]|uniref:NADH dehydrogenase [ubiquinone] 1 alpha subcomplex subunit n=1 Tax=Cryptococcus floricola TaxID=2591691 RepID=A0A5D3B6V5_9TREE|nr:hypothetical protein B9479_001118 [Cryptococcus floricola]
MSAFLKNLRHLLPFAKPKGLAGYDLQGNRYFELPNPMGGRLKRSVEYAINRDIAEYGRAELKPPVQWRAWLSHTRSDAPSRQELEKDLYRQNDLLPKIAAIEAREREERIRQGYLLPDGSEPEKSDVKQVTAPSEISGERRAQTQRFIDASNASRAGTKEAGAVGREKSAPASEVAPPRRTIDPTTASPEELRKLAEEDTKRRIAQTEGAPEVAKKGDVQSVQFGEGGLAPKRRGGKK